MLLATSEMVVIGPEKYLVNGTVDFLESHNYKVFGPNEKCSKIEGSKVYSKEILNPSLFNSCLIVAILSGCLGAR